ncbi:MAG TPA: 23S rRNA (adenine(2503)-C(2))-methyltransferase RlmN, partial [Dermatophilaceae bacterium]|nr:23S rRNA (adenine(2503)-C(2))-methyltransferase RlmN [Dermatophilaceae bacterium]HQG10535.1 23S rRNA (adenine(2503)-C(2))-methyltransferase RlmN [Dermatophilaceae bacterium]
MTNPPEATGVPSAAPAPRPTRRPAPGELTFEAPRRGMPPRHLADLDAAGRKAAVEALGHKGFRAGQLSKHYFERLVDAP